MSPERQRKFYRLRSIIIYQMMEDDGINPWSCNPSEAGGTWTLKEMMKCVLAEDYIDCYTRAWFQTNPVNSKLT